MNKGANIFILDVPLHKSFSHTSQKSILKLGLFFALFIITVHGLVWEAFNWHPRYVVFSLSSESFVQIYSGFIKTFFILPLKAMIFWQIIGTLSAFSAVIKISIFKKSLSQGAASCPTFCGVHVFKILNNSIIYSSLNISLKIT